MQVSQTLSGILAFFACYAITKEEEEEEEENFVEKKSSDILRRGELMKNRK